MYVVKTRTGSASASRFRPFTNSFLSVCGLPIFAKIYRSPNAPVSV